MPIQAINCGKNKAPSKLLFINEKKYPIDDRMIKKRISMPILLYLNIRSKKRINPKIVPR